MYTSTPTYEKNNVRFLFKFGVENCSRCFFCTRNSRRHPALADLAADMGTTTVTCIMGRSRIEREDLGRFRLESHHQRGNQGGIG